MIDEIRTEIRKKERSLQQNNAVLQQKDSLIRELQTRLMQFEQK